MKASAHFPSVRLVVAGYSSLVLLGWIGFVPGCLPDMLFRSDPEYPVAITVTAGISLFILVTLGPVFWHGPWRERALGVLLSVFPALTFGATAFWLGTWALQK